MLNTSDYFVTVVRVNWRLFSLHCWQYSPVESIREFHDEFLRILVKIGVLSTQKEKSFEVVCPSSKPGQDRVKEVNCGPMLYNGQNGKKGPFFFTDEINARCYLEANYQGTPYHDEMFVKKN